MEVNLQKMMRDPSTASSRIYIGNIPEGVSQQDIQNKFSKYGLIRGVLLNRGFGFVQFDIDNCANQAIQHENGSQLNGRKLNVRNAMKNKPNATDAQVNVGPIVGQDLNRQARPVMTQNWNNRSILQNTRDMGGIRDRSPLNDKAREEDRWGNSNNGNNFQAPAPAQNFNDRNDCEIIVVNKALTQYAEAVEARLKRLGMLVDLLFPNPDVPMGKVLANISSRGSLFAIVVTPQNQEHRSITVNILFGEPAEHRNMPVDDAIEFIFRTFEDQMRGPRPTLSANATTTPVLPTAVQITPTASYAAPPLNTPHPEAIQLLINLLAENRPITVLQYDRVIKYLQERRELQLKAEVGDAPPDIPIPPPVDTEVELQKKILDILNKPSITNTPKVEAPKPAPPKAVVVPAKASPSATSNSKPQLLNDPQVQKALDSLLSGSMFKF
ncbi:nuclear receptor coactivator 5 [Bradysia coprophila]|uniref:nuclear receptor coactivator 5 n=1 Tax=Bradysia coprophila TaxID=38358 RepID=UPI00187DC451|nr:nuclear receptor coactivator 5 [Bradysia coprophila]XP_037043726.1 nuclear receptor coactivator 5 [Bradysia coprophila]